MLNDFAYGFAALSGAKLIIFIGQGFGGISKSIPQAVKHSYYY
jgi:hypothetical protein